MPPPIRRVSIRPPVSDSVAAAAEAIITAYRNGGKVITCEEHSVIGGLGEAVCSVVAEKCPAKVARLGVNDEFGHSGPGAKLLEEFGLSAEGIVKKVKEIL